MKTLASVACDAPFFPFDMVASLVAARDGDKARIDCAASGGRMYPVSALGPVSLREKLRRALREQGAQGRWRGHALPLDKGATSHRAVRSLFNINTSADLAKAEPLLAMARPFDNRDPGV